MAPSNLAAKAMKKAGTAELFRNGRGRESFRDVAGSVG
jgi:hypothetical protein